MLFGLLDYNAIFKLHNDSLKGGIYILYGIASIHEAECERDRKYLLNWLLTIIMYTRCGVAWKVNCSNQFIPIIRNHQQNKHLKN